jgi:hypothetical protein
MKIVQYKLKEEDGIKSCPDGISNGGWWHNPDDHSFIGFAEDNSVPQIATVLTTEELEQRQVNIHLKYPMTRESFVKDGDWEPNDGKQHTFKLGTPTEREPGAVIAIIQNWVNEHI